MQPVTLVDIGGSTYRAFTNTNIPAGQTFVDWIFYPNWSAASFLAEDVSWTKTGGSDSLFAINPAGHGYNVPQGGFVMRCQRAAIGGAGTSGTVSGLTSGGLRVDVQVNMAQVFSVANNSPASIDAIVGANVTMSGQCNYGSGTVRTAELMRRRIADGGVEVVATFTGNTSGAPQLATFSYEATADVEAAYWWSIHDGAGRTVETSESLIHIVTLRSMKFTVNGAELYPGQNPNTTSQRYSARAAGDHVFTLVCDPPVKVGSPVLDSFRITTDSTFNATRCTAEWNPATGQVIANYPANAVSGSGGITLWSALNDRLLIEWSAIVPGRPAMTEFGVGTVPSGVTVTRVNATRWNVSLALSGAAKDLNILSVPTGSSMASISIVNAGDSTVCGIGINNNVSWRLTPRKVGSTVIRMQTINYSADPEVYVDLYVTVT